ncbi:MAG TPA: bifunctional nuclease family protein [Candidatus Barnesiella merdipullorum]|nr:bifunctional nuclease family protein [Candidatus Barnesiella merdipullorum]
MKNRIKLKVLGLTYSQVKKGAYALVLAEEDGPRRIPVVIGVAEAQSIAISLEGIIPPRPITHDLFVSFAHGFGIRLKEVCIYKFENGVFSSEMIFDDGTREIRLDARTSDAIAIALRTRSDIFVMPEIIEEAGFIYEGDDDRESVRGKKEPAAADRSLSNCSRKELKDRLEKAIASEAYEEAARIQEELNKRDNHL